MWGKGNSADLGGLYNRGEAEKKKRSFSLYKLSAIKNIRLYFRHALFSIACTRLLDKRRKSNLISCSTLCKLNFFSLIFKRVHKQSIL